MDYNNKSVMESHNKWIENGCSTIGCQKFAEFICSRCKSTKYCSVICQKLDWKSEIGSHYKHCFQIANNNANKTQGYHDIVGITDEVIPIQNPNVYYHMSPNGEKYAGPFPWDHEYSTIHFNLSYREFENYKTASINREGNFPAPNDNMDTNNGHPKIQIVNTTVNSIKHSNIKTPNTNKRLLDDQTTPVTPAMVDQASGFISCMSTRVTGLREGEYVLGVTPMAKKAMLQLTKGFIKPCKKDLDIIRVIPHKWREFLEKLGSIPFFSTQTIAERAEWLKNKQSVIDDMHTEAPSSMVKVIEVGESKFNELLSEEEVEQISDGREISLSELYKKFPNAEDRDVKNSGKKVTLIFFKSNWKIIATHQEVYSFSGCVVDLCRGKLYPDGKTLEKPFQSEDKNIARIEGGENVDKNGKNYIIIDDGCDMEEEEKSEEKEKEKEESLDMEVENVKKKKHDIIYLFNDFTKTYIKGAGRKKWIASLEDTLQFGIIIPHITSKEGKKALRDEVNELILEFNPNYTLEDINTIHSYLGKLRCGALKSLIQKLIRYASNQVNMAFESSTSKSLLFKTEFVLCVAMSLLLFSSGSFVPDIQKFVTGLESLVKRLVVIAFEDSCITNKKMKCEMVTLIACSILSQRVRTWFPPLRVVKKIFHFGLSLLQEKSYFEYSIQEGLLKKPYTLSDITATSANKEFKLVSALMDNLKSFQGDMAMIRYIASKPLYGKSNSIIACNSQLKTHRPNIMPLCHFVDQHWAPDIAYFYDYSLVNIHSQGGSKPFAPLFSLIFNAVTGINPRKHSYYKNVERLFEKNEGEDIFKIKQKKKDDEKKKTEEEFQEKLFEKNDFVKKTRKAQKRLLLSKGFYPDIDQIIFLNRTDDLVYIDESKDINTQDVIKRYYNRDPPNHLYYKLNYSLDKGWIAGMLGPVKIKLKDNAGVTTLVSLDPEDLNHIIVIRQPTKNMKSPILSEDEEQEAKEIFISMLSKKTKKGIKMIKMNKCAAPVDALKNVSLFLKEKPNNNIMDLVLHSTNEKNLSDIRKSILLNKMTRDILLKRMDERGDTYKYCSYCFEVTSELEIRDNMCAKCNYIVCKPCETYNRFMVSNGINSTSKLCKKCYRSLKPFELRAFDEDRYYTSQLEQLHKNQLTDQTMDLENEEEEKEDEDYMSDIESEEPFLSKKGNDSERYVKRPRIELGDVHAKKKIESSMITEYDTCFYCEKYMDERICKLNKCIVCKSVTCLSCATNGHLIESLETEEGKVNKLCSKCFLTLDEEMCSKFYLNEFFDDSKKEKEIMKKSFLRSKTSSLLCGDAENEKNDTSDPKNNLQYYIFKNPPKEISDEENNEDWQNGYDSDKYDNQRDQYQNPTSSSNKDISVDETNSTFWECILNGSLFIPYIKKKQKHGVKSTFDLWIKTQSCGIYQNSWRKLDKYIEKILNLKNQLPSKEKNTTRDIPMLSSLIRCLTHMSGFKSIINLPKITKDGSGSEIAVVKEDIGAFEILLKLSSLFPGALSKLNVDNSTSFRIKCPPLLWEIKNRISDILNASKKYAADKWGKIQDVKRTPYDYQVDALNSMKKSHSEGRRGHFIWIPVGMGKTYIVLSYLKYLMSIEKLPKYVIYTLPSEAIASIIKEIKLFNFDLNLVLPVTKSTYAKNALLGHSKIPGKTYLCPYAINLIEHDHMRKCGEELLSIATQSIVIVDEVHKTLNASQRTSMALTIGNLSEEFIALTGTPLIDTNTCKLVSWLEKIMPFEVTDRNFWVAANGMISKKVNTGVKVNRNNINAEMNEEQQNEYTKLVPPSLNGTNMHSSQEHLFKAIQICYDACSQRMVIETIQRVKNKKGVFLVAKDYKHQVSLYNLLLDSGKIQKEDIFLIQGQSSLYLTDDTVLNQGAHDYKVVITTLNKSTGYTLSRLKAMVTCVYPSNAATREQIEGRINRLGQSAKEIEIVTVMCGVLENIFQKHKNAKNLISILETLAHEIKF